MKTVVSIALSMVLACGLVPDVRGQEQRAKAAAPASGAEWLAPFVDDASMAAVIVDVARLDVDALAELMKAAGEKSGATHEGDRLGRALLAWKEGFVKAGALELAVVFSLKDPAGPPAYFVVRPREGADLEALRAHVDAPQAEGGQHGYGTGRSAVIERGCVVVASELQRKGLGVAERGAALASALELAGDSPVRIALFPADYAKRAVLESMPRFAEALGGGDTRAVMEGLLRCGGALNLGAEPSMRVKLACATDADAARLTAWMNERASSMPAGYAGVVKPVQEGALVRVEASGEPVRALVVQLGSNVIVARRAAEQMRVMVKARNAIMGCWLYSQSHQDAFPESLDQLVTDKHVTSDVIRADDGAELFVYIRPTADALKDAPSETVMMYEKFKEWPVRGLAVGFVDGHVEIIGDRDRFEKLLARKPEKPASGNPGLGGK